MKSFAHYCPICGRGTDLPIEATAGPQHRCSPAFVARHDAALESERTELRTPTLRQRLSYGFYLLGLRECPE